MASVIQEWQADGGDAAAAFDGLILRKQVVEVVRQFGRWQPWNLGAQVDPGTYRARAYGAFAFIGELMVMHPEIGSLADIEIHHYAEVIQVWQWEGLPDQVLADRKRAMAWLFDCLTDPDDCPYQMEGAGEVN